MVEYCQLLISLLSFLKVCPKSTSNVSTIHKTYVSNSPKLKVYMNCLLWFYCIVNKIRFSFLWDFHNARNVERSKKVGNHWYTISSCVSSIWFFALNCKPHFCHVSHSGCCERYHLFPKGCNSILSWSRNENGLMFLHIVLPQADRCYQWHARGALENSPSIVATQR